jgi:Transposase DDE domain group 1
VAALAEDAALCRIEGEAEKVRRYGKFTYAAQTWGAERRVIARVEASGQGSDSRFIVTNLAGTPRWLYEAVYCARGRAENRIKAHKLHLASDRTSCSKATANQFRLVLHTAAYWLLHTLHGLAPRTSFWRAAQFDTLRLALIKGRQPGHRAGDPDQARAAVQLSLPRQPRAPPVPGRKAALSRGAVCPDRARSQ